GLDDGEEGVGALAVGLDLGALVPGAGVLDGQRVQIELADDDVELLRPGVLQTHPQKVLVRGAGSPQRGQGLGQVAALLAPASAVDGLVDDHAAGERTAYPPVGTSALVEQTTQHTQGERGAGDDAECASDVVQPGLAGGVDDLALGLPDQRVDLGVDLGL